MTLGTGRSLAYRAAAFGVKLPGQALRNLVQPFRRRPVIGDAPVVVAVTSHGSRLRSVWHTIESIAAGVERPRRLVLWVDDADERDRALRSRPLRRLLDRGLEIRVGEPCGPHGKWWPHVRSSATHALPLVTADDDVRYDREWLRSLVQAHAARPDVVHCHRAHRMRLADGGAELAPYMSWSPCLDTEPSSSAFITGVSGVLHPPAFLEALHRDGDAFMATTPRQDDVWLTARAIAHGYPIAQVAASPRSYPELAGGQRIALSKSNGTGGGTDRQLAATFTPDVLRVIAADLSGRCNAR